jgi:hypothetical protein
MVAAAVHVFCIAHCTFASGLVAQFAIELRAELSMLARQPASVNGMFPESYKSLKTVF